MKRITVEFDRSKIADLPMVILNEIVKSHFKNKQSVMYFRLLNRYSDAYARYYVRSIIGKDTTIRHCVKGIRDVIKEQNTDKLALKIPNSVYEERNRRRALKLTLSKLTKRQLLKYATLDKNDQKQYLESFLGKKQNLYIEKKRGGVDKLKERGSNYFLKLARSLKDPLADKAPLNNHLGDWIGVEIECTIPHDAIANYIGDRDVEHSEECYEYDEDGEMVDFRGDCNCESEATNNDKEALAELFNNEYNLRNVSIKHDGSIDAPSGYFGIELTVFFRRQDKTPLKDLCKALSNIGAKVNRSCGLHIHLDQRDVIKSERRLNQKLDNFRGAVEVMKYLVPKSRRDNSYCKIGVSGRNDDRYYAVNATALNKYKTIEIRLHSGSIDFTKISNWIDLCYGISVSSVLHDCNATTIDELLEYSDCSDSLTSYYLNRFKQLNKNLTQENTEAA
jgi:RNA binding exosome subunit